MRIRWIVLSLLWIGCDYGVRGQVITVHIRDYPLPGTVTPDTIYYGFDRKLQWSDFTGKVRPASPSAALSLPGFSYDATTREKKDSIWISINVQVYFVRSGSWVRPGQQNPYNLSHEQIHFDIAKVAAEGFKDSLRRMSLDTEYYASEIHFLYWDFWRKMTRLQEQFDGQTAHGRDPHAEAAWKKKISDALLSSSNQDLLRDE
jgi:hypothetical protein